MEYPTGRAGREEKSDLAVEVELRDHGGLEITVNSSVKALYGKAISAAAEGALRELGVTHGRLGISDKGALDWVIRARIEAAVRAAGHPGTLAPVPATAGADSAGDRNRLRRTRLYLPGSTPDLMLNAHLFGADCLILDLEDSVAPPEKFATRILVKHALRALEFGRSERIVRINPLATPFGTADLEVIVAAGPDTLLIPKCEGAADITAVEERVAALEKAAKVARPLFFMPLIETAKGVMHAYEIATSSPRNVALCFGAEDFTADLGVERTVEGKEHYVARSLIVLAARAAGIQAIDTVYSDVQDEAGLVASAREAMAQGFDGKGVIHPSQIKPVHAAFSPSPEQIEKAQRIVAALEEARAKGLGVVSLGTKMVDAPVVARAQKILERARIQGLLKEGEKS
ncbi:MAG TPA: aldolase/citrate lyase family protein [bacterium]|nr:aldolase/citrate lyase family protein [bacterium]HPR89050.1 aldolase/citrate lyase family protein [bacterium]